MYKPDGHTDLSPYLIVDNARDTLDFVSAVFGGETIFAHRSDAGEIVHAEARIGDSVVMVGQMPESGSSAHLHVYVEDVEDAFERAVAAGATVVQPLMVRDDGDRRGGVKDKSGTTWWLSRQEQARQ